MAQGNYSFTAQATDSYGNTSAVSSAEEITVGTVGTSGDDSLTGTAGDDTIDTGGGADTVYTGSGDDVITTSGSGDKEIHIDNEGSKSVTLDGGDDHLVLDGNHANGFDVTADGGAGHDNVTFKEGIEDYSFYDSDIMLGVDPGTGDFDFDDFLANQASATHPDWSS